MAAAKDIMDTVRSAYLNDPTGGQYTDPVLMPQLRIVYDQLQNSLQENGLEICEKSEVKTIPANTNEYYPLPPYYFLPSYLEERRPGSQDEYSPMYLYRRLPVVTKGSTLLYWAEQEDRIKFVGATVDREVKIHYQSTFPAVNTGTDAVFGKAEQFLAAKLAAMVHMFITQSPTLAEVANQIAEGELAQIINMQVKKQQAIKSRPLPYLPFRRR